MKSATICNREVIITTPDTTVASGQFVGIVTIDDLLEILAEQ